MVHLVLKITCAEAYTIADALHDVISVGALKT